MQLNVVFERIARLLENRDLFRSGPKLAIPLSLNVKRFQSGNHLLVHDVVVQTLVMQGVHRYLE